MRSLAHENLARRSGLLQARGHVHGLTRRKGRVGLVDDDLAGLDADACLETELANVIQDPQAGPDGPVGVILVRDRDTECRHHGVAGELFDRAAVGLDAALDTVEEGSHAATGDLRILA